MAKRLHNLEQFRAQLKSWDIGPWAAGIARTALRAWDKAPDDPQRLFRAGLYTRRVPLTDPTSDVDEETNENIQTIELLIRITPSGLEMIDGAHGAAILDDELMRQLGVLRDNWGTGFPFEEKLVGWAKGDGAAQAEVYRLLGKDFEKGREFSGMLGAAAQKTYATWLESVADPRDGDEAERATDDRDRARRGRAPAQRTPSRMSRAAGPYSLQLVGSSWTAATLSAAAMLAVRLEMDYPPAPDYVEKLLTEWVSARSVVIGHYRMADLKKALGPAPKSKAYVRDNKFPVTGLRFDVPGGEQQYVNGALLAKILQKFPGSGDEIIAFRKSDAHAMPSLFIIGSGWILVMMGMRHIDEATRTIELPEIVKAVA